jgi:flagellar biosynthesis protein FliP
VKRLLCGALILLGLFALGEVWSVSAQAPGGASSSASNSVNFGVNLPTQPKDIDVAIRILFVMTLLTLAPSMIMLMTSFTRIFEPRFRSRELLRPSC